MAVLKPIRHYTTMARNLGGQKRIIYMPCGKSIAGNPREADNKAMLHRKYCETCSQSVKYEPSPFNSYGNDRANITMSRHGNVSKANKKTIRAINDSTKTVQVSGVSTAEQASQTLRQVLQLSEDSE